MEAPPVSIAARPAQGERSVHGAFSLIVEGMLGDARDSLTKENQMPQQFPMFPLPDVALFPRTQLPLHIFEPRYRAMMEAVQAGGGHMILARLREGYQDNYFGAPPVHRIMTKARVLFADKLDDGRWNILVEGIERVELRREIDNEPFRMVEVESLVEEVLEGEKGSVAEALDHIIAMAEEVATYVKDGKRMLTNLLNTHMHPSVICDVVAGLLVIEPYARQSILEERSILRRLKLLAIQMQALILQLREAKAANP